MEKGQLIFNLKNIETYDPEDFYISKSNFNVSTLLKFHRTGLIVAVIFKKSGKTHLLNIWSGYNDANLINALMCKVGMIFRLIII